MWNLFYFLHFRIIYLYVIFYKHSHVYLIFILILCTNRKSKTQLWFRRGQQKALNIRRRNGRVNWKSKIRLGHTMLIRPRSKEGTTMRRTLLDYVWSMEIRHSLQLWLPPIRQTTLNRNYCTYVCLYINDSTMCTIVIVERQ